MVAMLIAISIFHLWKRFLKWYLILRLLDTNVQISYIYMGKCEISNFYVKRKMKKKIDIFKKRTEFEIKKFAVYFNKILGTPIKVYP